jgi:hypothetical protein
VLWLHFYERVAPQKVKKCESSQGIPFSTIVELVNFIVIGVLKEKNCKFPAPNVEAAGSAVAVKSSKVGQNKTRWLRDCCLSITIDGSHRTSRVAAPVIR